MTEVAEVEVEATATVTDPWINPYPVDLTLADAEGKKVPQIHRAMFNAKLDMPAIAKNGTMELGGKSIPFTKIDDIKAALYPVLEKHGIMTYPVFVEQDTIDTKADAPLTGASKFPDGHELAGTVIPTFRPVGDGRIPTRNIRVQVVYDIQFVFVGDNSGVVVRVIGEAMDTSADKATGKATTAAIKRAFVETFGIVDRMEVDIESVNPEDGNRAATTDRREAAGDRGVQQRQAASGMGAGTSGTRRSGPQRSVTTNPSPTAKREAEALAEETGADVATGELPPPAPAPEESTLDVQKRRVREANAILKMQPAEVNALATQITGKATREEWSVLPTAVKKIADELEARVAARSEA